MKANGLTQDAPLLLLFDKAIDEVSRQLDAYVDGTNEVSITHNKFGSAASASLLFHGLVFSARVVDPSVDYKQYKRVFCNIDSAKISAVLALDLGDNIKGGETIAPIIKGLIALARRLGQGSGAVAAAWRPAMVLSDFGYFAQAVASYEEDGVFPVLALVDFQLTDTDRKSVV